MNPPQAEAVSHLSGPLLILAGAGSGKTRVLAHRVAYLIATSYKPWQILAVTFTNKAAGEMRDRIAGLIGEEAAREATIGTFHSICARILRRDGTAIGLTRSFTIYDRADQVALVKSVLRRLDLDEKRFGPSGMLAWIGQRKDEMADVATALRQATNYYDETAARVYEAYQRQLTEDDAVDFDDLLMRTVQPVREPSRCARPLPVAVAADHGRRVPGHEPRAVPHLPLTWPRSRRTWPWSVTTTSRSTPGAAPTSATSSTSRPTTRTPRS